MNWLMPVGKSIAARCSFSGARSGTKVMLMSRPSTYEINSAYFASIDTPNKAYWLGVLAAYGCLYYTHNKWRFVFVLFGRHKRGFSLVWSSRVSKRCAA